MSVVSYARLSQSERNELHAEVATLAERAAVDGNLDEIFSEYRDLMQLTRNNQADFATAVEVVKERLSAEKTAATLAAAKNNLSDAEAKLNAAADQREKLTELQKQLSALQSAVTEARGAVVNAEQAKVRARQLAPKWRKDAFEQRCAQIRQEHSAAIGTIKDRIDLAHRLAPFDLTLPGHDNTAQSYAHRLGVGTHKQGGQASVNRAEWLAALASLTAEVPHLQAELRTLESSIAQKIQAAESMLDSDTRE